MILRNTQRSYSPLSVGTNSMLTSTIEHGERHEREPPLPRVKHRACNGGCGGLSPKHHTCNHCWANTHYHHPRRQAYRCLHGFECGGLLILALHNERHGRYEFYRNQSLFIHQFEVSDSSADRDGSGNNMEANGCSNTTWRQIMSKWILLLTVVIPQRRRVLHIIFQRVAVSFDSIFVAWCPYVLCTKRPNTRNSKS